MAHVSRRLFMAATPAALVGATAVQPEERPQAAEPDDHYPVTPIDRASEFVGACHVQFDKVKAMLKLDAGLAKASWDWGFGDWETAIGAASHTGRVDIVELLIAHGARPTIFTLATLDRVDALRDLLENVPNVDALEGPHSISLYRHARAGEAKRVLEYLEGRGAIDTNPFAIEKVEAEPYFGVYTWGPGETDRFEVGWFERMSAISLTRPGFTSRNLMPIGDHAFSPAGARHVRMRFDVENGSPVRLHVPWAGQTRIAERF